MKCLSCDCCCLLYTSRGKCLVDAIFSLEKFLTTASPNHDFNRRTSVHIHVGVRYLTVEQLLNLILLYLVVEPIFFAFAEKYTGYRRQDNNFCVPISQSTLSLNLPLILSKLKSSEVEVVHELGKRWKKYTGLNLLPICTQGTIEFRHLGGTIQFETLYQWISMIQNLRGFAKTHSTEVIHNWIYSLNSSSNYIMFLTEVLGSFWSSAVPNELVQPLLEESVELTKEIISWKNKKTLLQISLQYWKDSTLATHLQDYIKSKQKNSTSDIPIAITEKYLQTLQQLTQIKEQFFFAPNSMNNTSEFLTLAHSLQLPGEVSTHTDNEVVPVSMPLILENL